MRCPRGARYLTDVQQRSGDRGSLKRLARRVRSDRVLSRGTRAALLNEINRALRFDAAGAEPPGPTPRA